MATTDTENSNGDKAVPPRQSRAVETRLRLINSGRDAFGRLGHDGVNLTRDILQPARVSVGSFYHQFEDKTDLLLEILGSAAEARRSAVLGLTTTDRLGLDDPDSDVWLASIYSLFFNSLDEESHGWRLQLSERSSRDPRIRQAVTAGRDAWIKRVAALLAHRSNTAPGDNRVAATMLVAHAIGIATLYLDLPSELPPEERSRLRTELIDGGVAYASGGLTSAIGVSDSP